MRKYSIFAISLFVFIWFFAFSDTNVPVANAEGVGQLCAGDKVNPPPPCLEIGCVPPPVCDDNLTCVNGLCQESGGSPGTIGGLACTCTNPGKAGSGQNGFSCGGGPQVFCAGQGNACFPAAEQVITSGNINFNGQDAAYQGKTLKGVKCQAPQPRALCKCIGRGTVNENNFECHLESDPSVTGTATCTTQEQCVDVPPDQGVSNTAANQRGALFSIPGGVDMFGIKCERPPATCTCDPTVAKNGFKCTQFGKTEEDTCDSPSMKCVNDPEATLAGGIGTEKNLFGGAPLKGIKCVDAPISLPPPPSPPCKTWGGTGQCTQFGSAFGDIGTAPEEFINKLFAILLSLSGGIAILLIMKAGYQMMTSQGRPEQLQAGRDQLIAAIVGLVFLIFSFVILQIIGFDILRLPGFGG